MYQKIIRENIDVKQPVGGSYYVAPSHSAALIGCASRGRGRARAARLQVTTCHLEPFRKELGPPWSCGSAENRVKVSCKGQVRSSR
jgi:hypothetical protein